VRFAASRIQIVPKWPPFACNFLPLWPPVAGKLPSIIHVACDWRPCRYNLNATGRQTHIISLGTVLNYTTLAATRVQIECDWPPVECNFLALVWGRSKSEGSPFVPSLIVGDTTLLGNGFVVWPRINIKQLLLYSSHHNKFLLPDRLRLLLTSDLSLFPDFVQ
jgi:hypothetical protein